MYIITLRPHWDLTTYSWVKGQSHPKQTTKKQQRRQNINVLRACRGNSMAAEDITNNAKCLQVKNKGTTTAKLLFLDFSFPFAHVLWFMSATSHLQLWL